jgi:anti-anti-sigma regulatory factor
MEAASQQVGVGGQGEAEQRLKIDKFSDGALVCLKFSGTIDESFDGKKTAATVRAGTLILDLAEIRKISSFGIREWVDFIHAVEKNAQKVILIECAPKVVDQLNMVANFAGEKGQVFSFYAPYRCDYCDNDSTVLLQVDRDWEIIKTMKPAERPCGSCGEPEYFDEDPTTYFSYIAAREKFELESDVAQFLSSKLNYTVSDSARRLRVDKIIEGRSTFLKLAGDLDGSFPREKLAEGLEGTVIIDLAGMGKIDPAGAAEWRGFLQMVTPGSESIFLLGVPPGFLEKLTKPEDLGPKAQVITFAMPYSCAKCATTATQIIDVEQHFDVLKFATPPEMKCGDCKSPTTCAATEGLLSHLPTLPKPSISPQTRKFIKEVQERKPEKKKATTVAEAAAQGKGGGAGMMIGAAVISAGLAVGGFFVYQYTQKKDDKGSGSGDVGAITVGKKVGASPGAAERPPWIKSDTFFSAQCVTEGDKLSCYGISSYKTSQDEAREEAKEAALEAVIDAVGAKITDPAWDAVVRRMYGEARQTTLAAFDKLRAEAIAGTYDKSDYDKNHREVAKRRKAVVAAFEATAPDLKPTEATAEYWEEYENSAGGGTRFLVFAQYELDADKTKRLITRYSETQESLGAKTVTLYPGLAWQWPQVDRGAVIVEVGEGKLRDKGVSTENVIQAVNGVPVKDAVEWKKVMEKQTTLLASVGGELELKVMGKFGPGGYTVQYSKKVEPANTGGNRGGGNRGGGTNSGSAPPVPWGNRGGGRDDPTQ